MFLKNRQKNLNYDLNQLSLKPQFKIEFLLPFTGSRKALEKMHDIIEPGQSFCSVYGRSIGLEWVGSM